MYNFREKLNVSKEYKFGVEIEFIGPNLTSVYNKLKKSKVPVEFTLNHKQEYCSYSNWIIDFDSTVSTLNESKDDFDGGEISSKILSNKVSDWKELKKVCLALQQLKAEATDICSSHITVDVTSFKDNGKFFETLFKIIILYENEIETFLMGDNYKIRKTKNEYAENVGLKLAKKIEHIDFKKANFMQELIFKNETTLTLRDAINVNKFFDSGVLEFRYPNGTLNAETIQNNINFLLCILDAIKKKKIDLSKITYLMNQKIKSESYIYDIFHHSQSITSFEELIEMISPSIEDEIYFHDQYQSILKTKK